MSRTREASTPPAPRPALDEADHADGPDSTDTTDGTDGTDAERREFVVDLEGHGQRLDRLLALAAPEFSRSYLQTLVAAGRAQVDGSACTHNARRLRSGQRVQVTLVPTAESRAFTPQPMELAIVFEDAHLLVLDKPAGLVVHPAAGNWSGTLLNGLLAHHADAARLARAGIVHRLDKDTSGLMVVGKTQEAVTALSRDIAARTVKREYLAIAWGEVQAAAQCIDAPIGRDPVQRTRMAVVAGARAAQTTVERVTVRDGFSALRCRLHTGRTHQIRVHLSHAGYPIVGDRVYNRTHGRFGGEGSIAERQMLHAFRLAFDNPAGDRIDLSAPLPGDMEAVLAQARLSKPDTDD